MLRVARSVGRADGVPGISIQELMHTSEFAWAETSLNGVTAPTPDVGVDRIGRIPVAVVVEIVDPSAITVGPTHLDGSMGEPVEIRAGGRLVVFGDSDFTTNELLDQTSNIDLLQNTLAWLVDEGDQISIRPNASAKSTLTLSDLDALIMWLLSAFVLPCLALGGAIALADWHEVKLLRPFVDKTKAEIARLAGELGVPLERTWSCYQEGPLHCGACGTCIERREALLLAGIDDPTEYDSFAPALMRDESGSFAIDWEKTIEGGEMPPERRQGTGEPA